VSDATVTYLVLAGLIVAFVSGRVPVELAAIGAGLVLYFTDVLDLQQVVAGYGDPAVVLIAALFVVSEGLDATGVTAWAGQWVIAGAGESRTRLLVLLMLLCGGLTALITVNGAVAALLPVVVLIAVRLGTPASKLLLPLAFSAHAGSMLLLTGTPVNVIVSDISQNAGLGGFGFLEFAILGVPLLAGSIVIVVLLGDRLLPDRTPEHMPPDFSEHARVLAEQYALDVDADRIARLRVVAGSSLVGRPRVDLALLADGLVSVVAVQREHGEPSTAAAIDAGDAVVVRGDGPAIRRLLDDASLGLVLERVLDAVDDPLVSRERGAAEVVVRPRSALVGQVVFPGMVTDSGDLVVLGVQRQGEEVAPGKTTLAVGDVLLVQGAWPAIERNVQDPGVLVVDAPALVRRQAVPMGPRSLQAVAVLAGMVVLLATGVVPAVVAGLLAAGAMILLRVLTMQEAYRAISWTTVILVAAMFPISQAMQVSGAANELAELLVDAVGDRGDYALLIALFVLTAALGQLVSNTATLLVVAPIALSAAAELGVSGQPLLMMVNLAAAAAFLTPVATPVNLMVMGPGGYRFGDYWKLGGVLMLWFLLVGVVVIPLAWSF
jgi:di/tricarboxylate transporter